MRAAPMLALALGMGAWAGTARADDAPKEPTPVEYYRHLSVSLTSGIELVGSTSPLSSGWTGLETQFGVGGAAGMVGVGASARIVFSGIVVGAQFGTFFIDRVTADAVLTPGLSAGYAIPLTNRIALTPSFHSIFVISTTPRSSAIVQLTGELGLEVFVGKHAFIEPVLSMGDLQDTGAGTSGQATFLFGVGYRLGVVF